MDFTAKSHSRNAFKEQTDGTGGFVGVGGGAEMYILQLGLQKVQNCFTFKEFWSCALTSHMLIPRVSINIKLSSLV